ncbi:hypothetical protein QZM43_32725 [Burkholderia orbicola]|uniref:hypothetical protein n=1 Tax=Burkholderia orbicola TaxID=2978683 RepID=UPI00264BA402|nr:hypothetical protein [Burkholderia orbicola]MDN7472548.1 hypothetical protein [Burkholderia orbicola]MDN7507510.1 hypothetical protein [Burkholderia orbicola]
MNYLKKQFAPVKRRWVRDMLLALALTGVAVAAQAGGMDAGKQGLSTLQIWLYTCAGIVAACYLIKSGVECFEGGGNWVKDFGTSCVKVFFCGAAVVLAGYLFSAGGS